MAHRARGGEGFGGRDEVPGMGSDWCQYNVTMRCIYCNRTPPDVEPDDAHVIPDVMGGSESSPDTVCHGCNNAVNRLVEMPALSTVLPLQSVFGIRGRKNKIRPIRAVAKVGDEVATVYIDESGRPTAGIIIPKVDAEGRKTFFIYGPPTYIESRTREIEAKLGQLRWEEAPTAAPPTVEAVFASTLTIEALRRLAAKVALERFAQLRTPDVVAAPDFDEVRSFVLTGNDPGHCAGILTDRAVIDGPLRKAVPPCHAVWVVLHPEEPAAGALVAFYGLFFYWVILCRKYPTLGPMDDLLFQYPVERESVNPLLRTATGAIKVRWDVITADYIKDRGAADVSAGKLATERLRAAVSD